MRPDRFRKLVLDHWRRRGRHDLPWRTNVTPYRVLVSEYMLQQTQVSRVIDKFRAFLALFPSFRALASATPSTVLAAWQGLGYNRRALLLHRCARTVVSELRGSLPKDPKVLQGLPGIGAYTAAAITVFAHDVPHALIETNVRRVYLQHFFPDQQDVPDAAILPLVERDVHAVRSPRIWFSALMDYGSWLAWKVPNANRRSKHYTRQSTFEGSVRQLRGRILRMLLERPRTRVQLANALEDDPRIPAVLARLHREGFIQRRKNRYRCA